MTDAARSRTRHLSTQLHAFVRWLVTTWQSGGLRYQLPLALWLLSMISIPIIGWTLGPQPQINGIIIATILQTILGIATLSLTWGWLRALGAAGVVGGITWAAEAVGTATGFPFGNYYYTDTFQLQVAHVPLLIPIAWMMVLPSAWAIGQLVRDRFAQPSALKLILFTMVAAAALTAWDFGLDPQMVGWGLWVWLDGGAYFGIPISNFIGWFGTGALGTLAVWWLVAPPDDALATDQLLLIYALTWFLMAFGLILFWDLAGPGFVLLLVMGFFLVLAGWLRVS